MHQNVTDVKFEFFKEWSKKWNTCFQELKEENDLFYESILQIMDRLDEDIKGIKQTTG